MDSDDSNVMTEIRDDYGISVGRRAALWRQEG